MARPSHPECYPTDRPTRGTISVPTSIGPVKISGKEWSASVGKKKSGSVSILATILSSFNADASVKLSSDEKLEWKAEDFEKQYLDLDEPREAPSFVQRSIDSLFGLGKLTEQRWGFRTVYMVTGLVTLWSPTHFSRGATSDREISGSLQGPLDGGSGAVEGGSGVEYSISRDSDQGYIPDKGFICAYQLSKIRIWGKMARFRGVLGGGRLYGVNPHFEGPDDEDDYDLELDNDLKTELDAFAAFVKDVDGTKCVILPPDPPPVDLEADIGKIHSREDYQDPHEREIRNTAHAIERLLRFKEGILPAQLSAGQRRVRVAIIDTGVDGAHPFIQYHALRKQQEKKHYGSHSQPAESQLAEDKTPTFDFADFLPDPSATPIDLSGHGTFIAGLILRLAPEAELFVARVAASSTSIQIDEKAYVRVAEALMHAVHNWKADIISLSVGFEDEKFPELHDAIQQAIQHNTIVMAAAGNGGSAFSRIPYPASEHGVFKIFSVDGMGQMPSNSPPIAEDASLDFAAPGVSVESIYPLNLVETLKSRKLSVTIKAIGTEPKGPWTVMTGTSFATPIAAAIAAVILQFCDLNRDQLKAINCRVVRNVLYQLSVPLNGGIHMLNPLREVRQDDQELISNKLLWIIHKAISSIDM